MEPAGATMTGTGLCGRAPPLGSGSLLLSLWVASPAAAAMQHTPALDALVTAAKAEGTLNIVWAGGSLGGAKGAAEIQDALNREFDAHFRILFTPGPSMPQMSTRTIQEVKAGQP